MAKKVTTSIRDENDFWADEDFVSSKRSPEGQKKLGNTGLVILATVAVCVILVVIVVVAYNNIKYRAQNTQYQYEQSTGNSQDTPAVTSEPVDISLSGTGLSSTDQFELPTGDYLVSYNYSNNLGTYGPTNFISHIKCAGSVNYYIENNITASGSGSEYISVVKPTKCVYGVDAAPQAQWSVSIKSN